MRALSGLMGTVLAIFLEISFKGIHSGSTLSITVSIFGLTLPLAICCGFIICAPGQVGFVLYTSALQFVDVTEVVLSCLNQFLVVVQPPYYTSPSGTSTGT